MTGGRRPASLLLGVCAAVALIAPATAGALNPVSFSPVAEMTAQRDGPGAATLPDGRVLVVGGYHSGALKSTEFFDPQTSSFSPGPNMSTPRYAPAVASLPDGRVLIAGGHDGTNVLASAEVFNPSSGSFSAVGSLSTKRQNTYAAPLVGGRVMVVAGDDGQALDSTEIFDPKTNTFSPGPTVPNRTYGPAVAAISGGGVLVAGGYSGGFLDSAFVFNPSSNAFSPVASLPAKIYAPASASLPQGRALVAGGQDGAVNDGVRRALIFDPAANSFSSAGIGSLNEKRVEAAAAELKDGRVLVAGGFSGPGGDDLRSAELLSVPSNAFQAKLKGRKVKFTVTNEGVAQVTDVSTQIATAAKKKKRPKLVKTTSLHGGPGTIVVKIKLTKAGKAKLRQKHKLKIRVAYTPDQGLAATRKLKLRAKKK